MSFTTHDLAECLNHNDIQMPVRPVAIVLAWGVQSREYADWQGGFVLQMEDDTWGYLSGESDSSGWG